MMLRRQQSAAEQGHTTAHLQRKSGWLGAGVQAGPNLAGCFGLAAWLLLGQHPLKLWYSQLPQQPACVQHMHHVIAGKTA